MTNHGSLQADKLGHALARNDYKFTNIFSSDLQRAYKTAEAVRRAGKRDGKSTTVERLPVLREQDFGFYEGKPFYAKSRTSSKSGKDDHRERYRDDPRFQDVESKDAMAVRMNRFLDNHLLPLLHNANGADELHIAIVSHGIILSVLWKCLLKRFGAQSVRLSSTHSASNRNPTALEHLGSWSNTGYLELEIACPTSTTRTETSGGTIRYRITDSTGAIAISGETTRYRVLSNAGATAMLDGWTMTVRSINNTDHLKGLKRTGGGVGSSKFDEGQKTIETFFKRRKV